MKAINKQEIESASLLISQLTDDDAGKRKNAVSSLRTIGQALGSARIKTQLLPHLKQQIVNDDDSQVIITMLKTLSSLGEVMGGGMEYIHLFALLEQVMQNQQEKVRNKAVQTYEKAIKDCSIIKCEIKVMASLKNILAFEYNDAKQGFIAVASKLLGDFSKANQQFLLSQYQAFAQSSVLVLRRFAAMYSKYLVQWLADFQAPILKIIEILFKDKDESNKIFLVDAIIALSKFKNQGFLQAYFNLISYQFPWRVRYELISKVNKLAEILGTSEKFKSFLAYMVKYINDIEPEIRSISCLKLRQIVPYVEADDIVNKIIPALKSIPQDNHVYVRNSLAKSLLSFCSIIGKKNTSQHLLPKFLQLLKDQEIEVQLTIFNSVNEICDVLGVDTLSQTTVPTITELAQHAKWRVRAASIQFLFYFIKKSGKEFMTEKIIKQVLDFVRDRASAVRKEGVKLLQKIQIEFGSEWFQKNLMPKVLQISKAASYMNRQIFLEAVQVLYPQLSNDYITKNINSIIYTLYITDNVENVRLTLCKVLRSIYDQCPKDKESIRKSLRVLANDRDKDVKELAQKLLKQIS